MMLIRKSLFFVMTFLSQLVCFSSNLIDLDNNIYGIEKIKDTIYYSSTKKNVTYEFSIDCSKDTIIKISESYSIKIGKGSFSYLGTLIRSNVVLTITIFDNLEHMYLNGLRTSNSNSDFNLESMFMLKVTAKFKGYDVDLEKGIELGFNYSNNDIYLFNMYESENGKNWNLANQDSDLKLDRKLLISSPFKNNFTPLNISLPTFYDNVKELSVNFSYNLVYPNKIIDRIIENIQFVNQDGELVKNRKLDSLIIDHLTSRITDSLFKEIRGSNVYKFSNHEDTLDVRFEPYMVKLLPSTSLNYLAIINNLGYINIDKKMSSSTGFTNFNVLGGFEGKVIEATLLIKDRRAIIEGKSVNGGILFNSIPIGEEVLIIIKHNARNNLGYIIEKVKIPGNKLSLSDDFKYDNQESVIGIIREEIKSMFQPVPTVPRESE